MLTKSCQCAAVITLVYQLIDFDRGGSVTGVAMVWDEVKSAMADEG